MADPGQDSLAAAAPAYDDVEARRARAGVAAALFGAASEPSEAERVAVGRYEIRSRLGAGGMGVVFSAHDPDLDRPVAVKLLHTDSATDDKARARMLREARALARLSHPNVITVYDVGTDDGRVFVAMELVAGVDLRRWLDGHKSAGWREVLGLFVAAGRGLAAAHEVALVHRDFKPENVLVGDDGRVRVLDFGLARLHQPVAAQTDADPERIDATGQGAGGAVAVAIATLPTAALAGGLTETGAMLGTPLYMAPEVYAGAPADERSDQFSFCASLYEGLYRQLPFGARTLAAHVEAVRAGKLVAPPDDSPVPVSVWQQIARGLSPDPQDRHASVAALLAALERAASEPAVTELPRGGSGRWLIGVLVVLLAASGLIGAELGWFGAAAEPPEPAPGGTQTDVETNPATPPSEPPAPAPAPIDAPEDAPAPEPTPASETGETGETGEAERAEPIPEPAAAPELHDWCHLHEDHFTLLARLASKRAHLTHAGVCYACRVERRASRTRSFSPRDCAGYLLCGPTAAQECE